MDQVKFVEDSLLEILLGPFLNILSHMLHGDRTYIVYKKCILIESRREVVIPNSLLASIVLAQWKLSIYCQKKSFIPVSNIKPSLIDNSVILQREYLLDLWSVQGGIPRNQRQKLWI